MKRTVLFAIVAALAATVAVSPTSAASASRLDGRWKTTRATLHELLAAGIARKDAVALERAAKVPALDFHHGAFKGLDLATGRVRGTGTYRLSGDVIRLVFRTGVAVDPGTVYQLRWSVYRDRLTFSSVPGRPSLLLLTLKPWTRVR